MTHPLLADALTWRARSQVQDGNHGAAELAYRRALAIRESLSVPDARGWFACGWRWKAPSQAGGGGDTLKRRDAYRGARIGPIELARGAPIGPLTTQPLRRRAPPEPHQRTAAHADRALENRPLGARIKIAGIARTPPRARF